MITSFVPYLIHECYIWKEGYFSLDFRTGLNISAHHANVMIFLT